MSAVIERHKTAPKPKRPPLDRTPSFSGDVHHEMDAAEGFFEVGYNLTFDLDLRVFISDLRVLACLWLRVRDDDGLLGERLTWGNGLTAELASKWADEFQSEIDRIPTIAERIAGKLAEMLG